VRLSGLWPAVVLVVLPLPLGVALGLMADTWCRMREARRTANGGDRIPE
jgi:uncharacterized membrane protein